MKIKIHNDGKEKHQSFEAKIDFHKWDVNSNYDFNAEGFGETEELALLELKNTMYNSIEHLNKLILEKEEIEYVDWKGDKIK